MNATYDNTTIIRKNLIQQSYKEYLFRRCDIRNTSFNQLEFIDCDFSRSGLVCLKIQNCVFKNCDLRNIDFSSCKVASTSFQDCKFMLAELNDNEFIDCRFLNTDFAGASICENEFQNCEFLQIDLNGSNTKLNLFSHPQIVDSIFGNCTISYNIMEQPIFKNSKINVETLGASYGISKENLSGVSFIVLGKEILETNSNIFECIYQDFLNEHLYIEAFVYDICFSKKDIIESMNLLIEHIQVKTEDYEYFLRDELKYLFKILQELRKKESLPFIALHNLLKCFESLITNSENEELPIEKYVLFYNNLYLMHSFMLQEIEALDETGKLEETGTITIKMVFQERPDYKINEVMNNMHEFIYGRMPDKPAQIVEERAGSYIVVITAMITTLAAFNLGTYLLVGGIKHLIKARAAAEVLTSKKLPRKYYNEIYKEDSSLQLSYNILNILNTVVKKNIPDQLDSLSNHGFNSSNMKDMEIGTITNIPNTTD